MPTGAELFVRACVQLGLDPIFTLVGDHLNEVLAAAARAGMRVVDMRHESAVTHAADAWARIHRRPALSLVTGGPGHSNSLTGMATANLAGSPLIAVSGSRARGLAERQAFQDIDQVGMARPVVKWAAEVPSAGEIPFYLQRAYTEANAGRRGAVHLTIPVDVFTGSAAETALRGGERDAAPSCTDVERATELLRAAKRPVAIAGSGVWWSGAERALREFVDRTQIPLYTITMARGTVPDDHPLSMGYADPALNYAVHTVFREADLFLVVGKRIDYRLALGGTRLFPAEAKFIQIDIHPQELGMNRALDAAICGDARVALDGIADAGDGRRGWKRSRRTRRCFSGRYARRCPRRCFSPGMAEISRTGAGRFCRRGTRADGCGWVRWGPSGRRCPTPSRCNWRTPGSGRWPSRAMARWASTWRRWIRRRGSGCRSC
jgi:acetolactate synthase-1/2/3 large subunit